MKTLLEKLLKFLGLLMLIIVVSLIPELIGGDIAAALKEKLGEKYYLTIGGIGLFAILAYTLWTEGDKIFKKRKGEPTAESVSEANLQKIRNGLLESYRERLKSKLAARFPINLELKYSTEGTTTKADIYDNKTIRSTKIKEELIHLFDKHRGRLLIIGEPGAGKTTLLLQLAYQLLFRQDPVITDIPIIINMATWRERFSSVEEWLKELLPQMGFSKGVVEQLLTENRLLPLFDGLDELGEDLRKPCLDAIAEFGKVRLAQYVICSRIVEYSETIDAPVYCQIMVKPLTITQIKEGLQAANSPETNGILDAMKKDPLLREAIKTPFYLNTVQLLFASSKVWEEFDFKAETLEGRQQEIVAFFVADATGGFDKYSSDQVKKYLGFLADRMTWKGLVEFELVSLQYDWGRFEKKGALIMARAIQGLVYCGSLGLIGGIVGSLMFGLFNNLVYSLLVGPGFGLAYGLIFGLLAGLFYGLIEASEIVRVKNKINPFSVILQKQLKTYLAFGLTIGLFFGFFLGLMNCILGRFFLGLFHGLIFGLNIGFLGGIIGGLIESLIEVNTGKSIYLTLIIFRKKLRLYPAGGLGGGVAFGFVFSQYFNPIVALFVSLLVSIPFSLSEYFITDLIKDSVAIKTKDSINWSLKLFKLNFNNYLIYGLSFGLIFSLTSVLFIILDGGSSNFLNDGAVEFQIFGLVLLILFYGLFGILYGGLIDQLHNFQPFLRITYPSKKFIASIWKFHFSILQHWHLKWLLVRKNLLAKKLGPFLKKATTQNLLESDGGSWRFRHRILQEYFAGHWVVVYGVEDAGHPARKKQG